MTSYSTSTMKLTNISAENQSIRIHQKLNHDFMNLVYFDYKDVYFENLKINDIRLIVYDSIAGEHGYVQYISGLIF